MLTNPGKPNAGEDVEAAEILGNFEGLDVRTASLESVIDNLTVDARTYGNGVFKDGLAASEVGTELQYSVGGLVNTHVYYPKTSLVVDFNGKAADTYYVEAPAGGVVALYTSTDVARTNLNTVIWDGGAFTSVTTADRNVLPTYQEIIDARNAYDSLDDRLDAVDTAVGLNTAHKDGDGSDHADVATNSVNIDGIEAGTTPLPVVVANHTAATLTLDNTMNTIVCDTTSNGTTITLPAVAGFIGYEFTIYIKTVSSGNHVTVNTNAADTLDGVSTSALMTLDDILIIRGLGGNRWLILDSTGTVLS